MAVSSAIEHLQIQSGDVELHLACQGEGPLVVMCHGYPGLWYSWRHQMQPIADAGFCAVAMDMRGYGGSSRPLDSHEYAFDKQSADVLAVLDHFGEQQAVLFGHDFGANLAWHMGIYYPDRIKAIAPLSVPYDMELAAGSDIRPTELYSAIADALPGPFTPVPPITTTRLTASTISGARSTANATFVSGPSATSVISKFKLFCHFEKILF